MSCGIRDIKRVAEGEKIVRINWCYNYFYDEITDERNDNSLKLFFDKDNFFKGCPECETDDYLLDVVLLEG